MSIDVLEGSHLASAGGVCRIRCKPVPILQTEESASCLAVSQTSCCIGFYTTLVSLDSLTGSEHSVRKD
jgi:hypothetical protein